MLQIEPSSPWLHPAFLISIAGTVIGLVAWFIRLESKTNSNQMEIERINDEIEKKSIESKAHRERIEAELLRHMMDGSKHYNEQFMAEFRNALDRRFSTVENALKDISGKIDRAIK